MDNIRKEIKAYRKLLKITQVEMAEKLNVSQNAYSKVELGYTEITITRLKEISDIFDVNIKYWF